MKLYFDWSSDLNPGYAHLPCSSHWNVSLLPLHSPCFPVYIICLICWRRNWKIDEVNWDCKSAIRIRSFVTFKISSLKSILLLLLLDNPFFFFNLEVLCLYQCKMEYLECFGNLSGVFRTRGVMFQNWPHQRSFCCKMTPCEHKTCQYNSYYVTQLLLVLLMWKIRDGKESHHKKRKKTS